MNETLVRQLVAEEGTPHVRSILLDALSACMAGVPPAVRRFEFNRFEVTLDAEDGSALVEDILDTSDAGMQKVPLAELATALEVPEV